MLMGPFGTSVASVSGVWFTDVGRGAPTNVLVVDDHRSFADAISLAVSTEPDLCCIDTVGSAEAAIDLVGRTCPDVVLLDVTLPGMSGIESIPSLRSSCPDVRILLLTADTTVDTLLDAIDAGADGFLPKERPFVEVIEAVRDTDGVPPLDQRSFAAVIVETGARSGDSDAAAPELTDREWEILLRLSNAEPAKAIAHELGISVHTCRGHVRALLAKFDAHSQLEAVVTAARLGMLPDLRSGRRDP